MIEHANLSSEQKIRLAVRAGLSELEPAYVEVLRNLPPGAKTNQAFALWRTARDALYRQGIEQGLSPTAAMQAAAKRLLETHNSV